MDKIQAELIKAGRKDLAIKYYEKVAGRPLQSGTMILVKPIAPGLVKSYPAGAWVKKETKVELMEDAPNKGTLDVLDVKVNGKEESIYDFQIVKKANKIAGSTLDKTAGTWTIPDTDEKIKKLKNILSKLKANNYSDLALVTKDLYGVFGDDDLFDSIDDVLKKPDKSNNISIRNDILNYISKMLENYDKNPKSFKKPLDVKALEQLVGARHTKVYASDPIIQQVGDAIKGKSLMSLRPVLEKIFPKKDIDFTHVGASHFRIKYKGKTLMIVNKKYVDGTPDLIVDELAIGYNL